MSVGQVITHKTTVSIALLIVLVTFAFYLGNLDMRVKTIGLDVATIKENLMQRGLVAQK